MHDPNTMRYASAAADQLTRGHRRKWRDAVREAFCEHGRKRRADDGEQKCGDPQRRSVAGVYHLGRIDDDNADKSDGQPGDIDGR